MGPNHLLTNQLHQKMHERKFQTKIHFLFILQFIVSQLRIKLVFFMEDTIDFHMIRPLKYHLKKVPNLPNTCGKIILILKYSLFHLEKLVIYINTRCIIFFNQTFSPKKDNQLP